MFIRKLGVSPEENQAGFIYQSQGQILRPLKSNPTQEETLNFLNSISYSSLATSAANERALRLSLETLITDGFNTVQGGRTGANRIAVIFTTTEQSGNLKDTADRLRVAGITPVFVGLGPLPNRQTANDLGVEQTAQMFLSNFSALTDTDLLDNMISKVLCSRRKLNKY